MFETPDEMRSLQVLLDTSLAGSGSHLRSIVRPGESTLGAEQVVRVCRGMCTLAVATVTQRGEPRISGVDGHLLHGRWIVGTHRRAAKARHLAARPGISATFLRGEELGVFTHGHAVALNPEGAGSDPAWPAVRAHLVDHYEAHGDDPFWDESIWYRIDPTWMVAYSSDPARVSAPP
ncbi:pyridoxamine 5'-phosphate oxidase family protein [Pseudonocardia sp. HH130630-07]|uniref:pyridoxamine 5'-phosphate oxidase family protein n=1 Tax=Pseudonocardia sp. HH130630-07 TaxID=1690815 RepID=UPI000814FD56|nr:pyridoxamine 5'-phosphate oxidase family protein [Pseudonocardia sp. HH130630-07]ANY06164.1 pyridoxamine 5'-phosphate oxidase [Pseudonocardia sp. HH130630-07]